MWQRMKRLVKPEKEEYGGLGKMEPMRKTIGNLLAEAEGDLLKRLHPHREILIVSNVLFMLLGFALILIGMLFLEDRFHYREDLAKTSVPTYLFINVYFVVFLCAVTILTLSVVGFVGGLRENLTWLKSYQYFIGVVTIIIMACLLITTMCHFIMKKTTINQAKKYLITDYTESDRIKRFVDNLQRKHNCCGIIKWNDWNSNRYFECKSDNPSIDKCSVPKTCCRIQETGRKDAPNTAGSFDPRKQCHFGVLNLTDSKAYALIFPHPCIKEISKIIDKVMLAVLPASAVVLCVFILVGFSARELTKAVRVIRVWADRVENYLDSQENVLKDKYRRSIAKAERKQKSQLEDAAGNESSTKKYSPPKREIAKNTLEGSTKVSGKELRQRNLVDNTAVRSDDSSSESGSEGTGSSSTSIEDVVARPVGKSNSRKVVQ